MRWVPREVCLTAASTVSEVSLSITKVILAGTFLKPK